METSSSHKRKLIINPTDQNEPDDDEDVKIEEFFALIRGIKEARDHLRNYDGDINKKKKRRLEEGQQVSVWKPCFQPEDFLEEPFPAKNPKQKTTNVSENKEESKDRLDLRLSL